MADTTEITVESLPELLKDDKAVKVAGIDVDGILRGKLMAKSKFLSIAQTGFGFCSVVFGWDMHDQTYFKELKISNKENGYRDIIAVPDLASFRRIPWEDNVPFFLVSFYDPDTHESLSACPRSLLKRAVDKLKEAGLGAMAGGELHNLPSARACLGRRCKRAVGPSSANAALVAVSQPSTSSTSSAHPRTPMPPSATPRRRRASCWTTRRRSCRA